MSLITNRVSNYVRDKGINISKMARDTGISYTALYASLCDKSRNRSLRDDEFLIICAFLEINPRVFANDSPQSGGGWF